MVYMILSESGVYCTLIIVIYFLCDTTPHYTIHKHFAVHIAAQIKRRLVSDHNFAPIWDDCSAAWAIRGHTHIKSSI